MGCNCNCTCKENNSNREEMMNDIRSYNFAITELGLYLDVHPDDQRAIALHKEYCKCYKDVMEKYQRMYGQLSIVYPGNKSRWLEEPWPWEGGNF